MLRVLLSRIWGTFRKHRLDDEIDEELRAHLDMLQERFIRRGMEPKEAFYAARRQFGGVTQVKQDLRLRRALPLVDAFLARGASRRAATDFGMLSSSHKSRSGSYCSPARTC